MCCLSGKIKIPRLDDLPPELHNLLSDQDDISKKFCDHIRTYNNALAMTSLRELSIMGVGHMCLRFKVDYAIKVILLFLERVTLLSMLSSTFTILKKHSSFA
jgi:hypothetical protein